MKQKIRRAVSLGLLLGILGLFIFGSVTPVYADSAYAGSLFKVHCASCHPNGGNVIRRGKSLKLKALQKNGFDTSEAIAHIIANGKNNMSAFSEKLNPAEIDQLADYVLAQAEQGWAS